jgi:uracil-DNA glycosylase
MEPETRREIADALKCRFESDALLGARSLPIMIPTTQSASPNEAPAISRCHTGVETSSEPMATQSAAKAPTGLPDIQPLAPRPPVEPAELEQRRVRLAVIDNQEVKPCVKCGLAKTRTKTVFGVGSPAARILFVGEAPGADEDASGEPFVGRAGKLLTDMIEKGMGLRREDVYICNVLKCRPPNNRTPASDEIAACKDYLLRQIEIIHPELIIALGAPAAQTLLGTRDGIGHLRGRFHDFYPSGSSLIGEPVPLLPTFHPAYLLRSPGEKVKAWADLKLAMAKLGIPLPKRG